MSKNKSEVPIIQAEKSKLTSKYLWMKCWKNMKRVILNIYIGTILKRLSINNQMSFHLGKYLNRNQKQLIKRHILVKWSFTILPTFSLSRLAYTVHPMHDRHH